MPLKKSRSTKSKATKRITSPPTKAPRSAKSRKVNTKLPFFTVGHSTRTIAEFAELLRAGGVQTVVDIRKIPRSRTNPQYNRDVLGMNLAPYGIRYTHLEELGGRRGKAKKLDENVNGFWQNRSFHNYADYALTDEFEVGLEKLIALGQRKRCAIMCSEAVWWRCHRRIVTDYLLARGETVFHLMGRDRIDPARVTEGGRVRRGLVKYPSPR